MYKGTLIADLMAAVQRAEQEAQKTQNDWQKELHEIFAMQIPVPISVSDEQVFRGAA